MRLYQIAEMLRIWRMSLELSAPEKARWKALRKKLSGDGGYMLPLVARYLTKRRIEESGEEERKREMKNALRLPNLYALGEMEVFESAMEEKDLERWSQMRKELDNLGPHLSEVLRRYAIMKAPVRVNLVVMERGQTH